MVKLPAWGRGTRRCLYCRKVGPRVEISLGWAHRRCIPKIVKEVTSVDPPDPANYDKDTV